MRVRVGCCGWAVRGGRQAYFRAFETVEIQETFYRIPRMETLEAMRNEAPPDFIYNMKAWQVITHPHTSPTWRRMRTPLKNPTRYGLLKPTKENFRAWEKVVEMADALKPRIIVLQTPPSFDASVRNRENVRRFFSHVNGYGLNLGWEPRGEWATLTKLVEKICERYGIIHIVDILRIMHAEPGPILYTRLHGLGGHEVNYSYKYNSEDLTRLKDIITEVRCEEAYVMFNNISMAADAARFKEILPA